MVKQKQPFDKLLLGYFFSYFQGGGFGAPAQHMGAPLIFTNKKKLSPEFMGTAFSLLYQNFDTNMNSRLR